MPRSTLSVKGQTTIPKAIRERLGLQPGDRIEYVVEEGGAVRIEAVKVDVRTLRGSLSDAFEEPLSVEEMEEAVRGRFGPS